MRYFCHELQLTTCTQGYVSNRQPDQGYSNPICHAYRMLIVVIVVDIQMRQVTVPFAFPLFICVELMPLLLSAAVSSTEALHFFPHRNLEKSRRRLQNTCRRTRRHSRSGLSILCTFHVVWFICNVSLSFESGFIATWNRERSHRASTMV